MKFYSHKKKWKVALLLGAVAIGVVSLWYTNNLVSQMEKEERKNMEIWAEAQAALASPEDLDREINFYLDIIRKNTTIPVILVDQNDSIITVRNLRQDKATSPRYQYKRLGEMKKGHLPIVIDFQDGNKNLIYYDDSTILKQLSIYPYVQLGIITIFIIIAYLAFSTSRKAEQNQVWVGMSKETAHQLGTPISSLMAWVELLDQNEQNNQFIPEIEKDIARLQMIAERFSKIGSIPDLALTDLNQTLDAAIKYMKTRTSKNVAFTLRFDAAVPTILPLNSSLFHWVIENLVKNSVDAMGGKGEIDISLVENEKEAVIEFKDTGKGIPKSMHKTVFKPGYTSKDRGWGLGLSLAKRIIENYHSGKIFVLNSEINQGTTFKITLPK